MHPKAKSNLLVDVVLDETLVYDLDRHRAHCLNALAGFVLSAADGAKSPGDLAALAETEFGPEATPEAVRVGLERLHRAGLIEWASAPADEDRLTRRETLKKIAVVGLLLPTVMTLTSPYPAQAATGLPLQACTSAQHVGSCCSNNRYCVFNSKRGIYECKGTVC